MIKFAEYLSENKKKHHHEKTRPHFSLDPEREKILQKVYGEKGLTRADILRSFQMYINQREDTESDNDKSSLSESIIVSFNSYYLTERNTSGDKEGKNDSDAKGKAFEILLGRAVAQKTAGKDLEDFRDEGKKADDILQKQKEILGEEHFNRIMQHANDHADSLIDHLEKTGVLQRGNITNVHWTSLADSENEPGDHEKLTGQKDLKQYGDIIITHKDENGNKRYVPISLKYGTNSKPNFKNNGLNFLENSFGLKSGTLNNIKEKTLAKIKGLYGNVFNQDTGSKNHEIVRTLRSKHDAEFKDYTKQRDQYITDNLKDLHDQHKASGGNLNRTMFKQKMLDEYPQFSPSEEVQPYARSKAIDITGRSEMVKAIHESSRQRLTDEGHDGHLRDFLREAICPSTIHKTYVSHAHVQSDGSVKHVTFDPLDILETAVLSKYKRLRTRYTGVSNCQIIGEHEDTGDDHSLAVLGLKSKSGLGVFTGINSTLTASLDPENPTVVKKSDHDSNYGNNTAKPQPQKQPPTPALNPDSDQGGRNFYSVKHNELSPEQPKQPEQPEPEKKTSELTDDAPARPENVKELIGQSRSGSLASAVGRAFKGSRSSSGLGGSSGSMSSPSTYMHKAQSYTKREK